MLNRCVSKLIHLHSVLLRRVDPLTGFGYGVSFEDLGLDFQDPDLMYLRSRGIVVLTVDFNSVPAVTLADSFRNFSPSQLRALVNKKS